MNPEKEARKIIDEKLRRSGWDIQNRSDLNLYASEGVAVREFNLNTGFADYLLFVDCSAVGVIEAKKIGFPLGGVNVQAEKYSEGFPDYYEAPFMPLPFCYMSTGVETRFINMLDPAPRSRRVFQFHRPETLAEWISCETLDAWVRRLHGEGGFYTAADNVKPSTLRSRLQTLPPLDPGFLFPNQFQAIINLDESLKKNYPRSLVQMATGSGKTLMAITAVYRYIKFGGARRILFLVDRSNLGEQAEKEFQNYKPSDDNRSFGNLYNVERLTTNNISASSKVVISTIQRLYSMLKGEKEFDPENEERSLYEIMQSETDEPLPVVYNKSIPPEYFDVIIVDECHRSIYTLWRQVLEYFDAFIIGLTATPAKHTFGFFNQNLVMEYNHEKAVADGVNVDFEVYRIKTKITSQGAEIEADGESMIGLRNRQTREVRWRKPDESIAYGPNDLDRSVVAKDQIRLILKTFKEKVRTEMFPGRKVLPKTLIFAKDDSHAEDITEIIKQVFGAGEEFCRKITYKTTGSKPSDLIQDFRNSYYPRIAVTVDMISTGSDIRPIEILVFMRAVRSRVLFEQMKGRGVRIINSEELNAVTPKAEHKTHFVIVDCVGVTEQESLTDTQPLERKKSVPFEKLLERIAVGITDEDHLSSLACRLARLDKQCSKEQKDKIKESSGDKSLSEISRGIIDALDPDIQQQKARIEHNVPPEQNPTAEQIESAAKKLMKESVKPLASNPPLRRLLNEINKPFEQIIDPITTDELMKKETGFSDIQKQRAKELVKSFEQFLKENRDEIESLQFFYSEPYAGRLRFEDIKNIHDAVQSPPRSLTPEKLWKAYEILEENKVRKSSAKTMLTDIISLIRFALNKDDELVHYSDKVDERFETWLKDQEVLGRGFTDEQKKWLVMMKDHIASSLMVEIEDFNLSPFIEEGGLGKAAKVLGKDFLKIIKQLNKALNFTSPDID